MKNFITLFLLLACIQTFAQSDIKIISEIIKQPDNLSLNHLLIDKLKNEDELIKVYDKLIIECPKSYIIPYLIGEYLFNKENPDAIKYLLRAIKINPKLPEPYYLLTIESQRRGNLESEIFYSGKARDLDQNNGKYAFQEAYSYYKKNKQIADSLMLEVARKFRDSEYGAEALFHLEERAENFMMKEIYFKQLLASYKTAPNKFYNTGMNSYFSFLINNERYEEAMNLVVSQIIYNDFNRLNWKYLFSVGQRFIAANNLLQIDPDSSLRILNKIKLNDSFSQSWLNCDTTLLSLKVKAMQKMGETEEAYHLILNEYAFNPSRYLYNKLFVCGKILDKTKFGIDLDVKSIRYEKAEQAKNITRINLLDSTKISINDLKGKVILLSLWYPGCGPCRAEMPHLENILKKVQRNEIVYLGINIEPKQDNLVKGFLEKTGYSFIPLNDNQTDKGNLFSNSYPANYLIDKKGKIILKGFSIQNLRDEEMLEMMINDLISYSSN